MLNFDSAACAYPTTMDYSRKVAVILRETPDTQTPNPRYVFYM